MLCYIYKQLISAAIHLLKCVLQLFCSIWRFISKKRKCRSKRVCI